MLSDDPELFALMMPTKIRPAFVKRALYFLDQQKFAGHLLCVDASDAAAFEANAQAIERFPGLNVSHHRSQSQGNTWPEIDDALAPFSPKYVQLHHDDDFYFTEEIDAAISVLEAEPDAASAQGRFVYVEKNLTDDDFSIASHERYGMRATLPRTGCATPSSGTAIFSLASFAARIFYSRSARSTRCWRKVGSTNMRSAS